jgi:hypothetical protein
VKYDGECIIQRGRDENLNDRLRVLRADPRITIAREILDEVRGNPLDAPGSFDGEYFRIRAVNRTVVYRVGEYLPDRQAYAAEWPD